MPASHGDFYEQARYCARCKQFVPYLLSPDGAFCVICDRELSLSAQRIASGPARRGSAIALGPAPGHSTRSDSTLPSERG
jgi:hypothetical protein